VAKEDAIGTEGVANEAMPDAWLRFGLAAASLSAPVPPSSAARGLLPPASPCPASRETREVAEYASGRVRDLFLAALDEADPGRTLEIARHLVSCGNPLPNATCVVLGLPAGSSYGAGARAIVAKAPGRLGSRTNDDLNASR
jgi:hypothetical protein